KRSTHHCSDGGLLFLFLSAAPIPSQAVATFDGKQDDEQDDNKKGPKRKGVDRSHGLHHQCGLCLTTLSFFHASPSLPHQTRREARTRTELSAAALFVWAAEVLAGSQTRWEF